MGPGISRRELLRRGAGGGAALALGPTVFGCSKADEPSQPRIAIVGAGLAGLACAHRLRLRGAAATIYEANPERIGGRCWSSRGWASGQVGEHGGEFIDTRHVRIRALATRFGLELTDLYAVPDPGRRRIWLNGALRSRAELAPGFAVFKRRIVAAARHVGPYGYRNATRAAHEFDELSVRDWLQANVPGGADSLVARAVSSEMVSEFGLDPERLSALNLFYAFAERHPEADERFHISGGNDQLVHALADELQNGTIQLNSRLEALARRHDGAYALRIAGRPADVIADQIVLCLPFATLREADLSRSGLSAKKRACINELGTGTNAKVLMQFDRRPHHYGNWNGYLVYGRPYYTTWQSSLGEPGRQGLLTVYFGGRSGGRDLIARAPHGPSTQREVALRLRSLDRRGATRITGIADGFTGRAWTDHWVADPLARGSYAAFLPGQYTRYYGYVGRPEGAIHFAGEHTATANQGFLEGAVESGERAADGVLAAIGRA
jgi:monoamine oxidase